MNSRATVASENSNTEVFDSLTHSFDRSLNREASAHAAPATRQAESVGTLIRNMLLNQHYRHR